MIETERQFAEKRLENVKGALIDSNVDYYLNETPFSLTIMIKKKLLKDFSSKSSTNVNLSLAESTSEKISSQPSSPNSTFQSMDSGFNNEISEQLEQARNELDEKKNNIVELENIINMKDRSISDLNRNNNSKDSVIADLKSNISAKDSIISKLNAELNSLKDISNNLKKDCNTKSEQLKQKKKSIDSINSKYEQAKTEHSNQVDNLKQKLDNLEKHNIKISTQNEKLSTELKSMIDESKRIADEKKKRQEKGTQFETVSNASKYIQTDSLKIRSAFQLVSRNDTLGDSLLQTSEKPTLVQCRLLLEILFPHPSQFNQLNWPEKWVLEKYQKEFGGHNCNDCITEDIPYKLIVGTQTSYRGEHIKICRNNLVPFNGHKWWE